MKSFDYVTRIRIIIQNRRSRVHANWHAEKHDTVNSPSGKIPFVDLIMHNDPCIIWRYTKIVYHPGLRVGAHCAQVAGTPFAARPVVCRMKIDPIFHRIVSCKSCGFSGREKSKNDPDRLFIIFRIMFRHMRRETSAIFSPRTYYDVRSRMIATSR